MHNPKHIFPCLWFNGQAEEAAGFYCEVFQQGILLDQSALVTTFEVEGSKFMALDGGPQFTKNPSISFFVMLPTGEEVEQTFAKLSTAGSVMIPLGSYPWSEKYGWCSDQYGVNWQIMIGKDPLEQIITPALMFTQNQAGQAEHAMQRYVSIFKQSSILDIRRYDADDQDVEGTVKHGRFKINGQSFIAFDSSLPHHFKFNEGISLVIPCDTQEEIDYYWEKLTVDGGRESMCGWLSDRYGVSWQIIPGQIGELMSDGEKAGRIMKAVMQMRKLNLQVILDA